tara:strand:- start:80 stop:334 length:255 start_codon:yes stop_codon:yes gene_type:complete
MYIQIKEEPMGEKIVNITETAAVDVELLKEQRNALLELAEVLANSTRFDVEEFFAFDRDDACEKIEGVVNLLDALLDDAEGYNL